MGGRRKSSPPEVGRYQKSDKVIMILTTYDAECFCKSFECREIVRSELGRQEGTKMVIKIDFRDQSCPAGVWVAGCGWV